MNVFREPFPASLTIPTPLLLGRNSSVVARSHSRRKGFNGDFWENPCHDEKRGKIPKQCREAFLTTLRLKWKYSPRFSHLQTVASISKKKSFIEIIKSHVLRNTCCCKQQRRERWLFSKAGGEMK